MQDYSAAALLRLIGLGLERQGLSGKPERARGEYRLDLTAKRGLLVDLRERHGLLAILRIGEVVEEVSADPMLSALFRARGVRDLLDRWLRLERYVHSHHRIEVLDEAAGFIRLRHFNARGGEPPTVEEDALIFGMLIGLLRGIGIEGLSAGVDPEGEAVFDRGWLSAPGNDDLSVWWLRWSGELAEPPVPSTTYETLSARIGATVEADPLRNWPGAEIASLLGLSSRSLQRRLQDEDASFREVVREARGRVAASLLLSGERPLSTVGFQAGYADQAHFTREFKRLTGLTPAQYRDSFQS